eukprot:1257122-Rhodomonas_salina.1
MSDRNRAVRERAVKGLVPSPIFLRACYAMSGTDLAYGATRSQCYRQEAIGLVAPYLWSYALPTRCT